jgi:putative restriction endonuclease
MLGVPVPTEGEAASGSMHRAPEEAEQRGREARFRLSVVSAYDYSCALTGYRLMTISAGSIIDAAHIHQFADSRNNDVRNGIALCKNAHWMFDEGLWTIDDDYSVKVAVGHFTECSPDQKALASYDGKMLRLPEDPQVRPEPGYLAWHRKRRFLGG